MATKKYDTGKARRLLVTEKATRYSTVELTALADVTDVDIEKAKAAWRRSVPKKYKFLLDAKMIKPDASG